MSKIINNLKPGNGKPGGKEDATVASAEKIIADVAAESQPPAAETKAVAPPKELSMQEKIMKVENLQLVIEKRAKLVETRMQLDRFQTASNDFNCSMRLSDSDGNNFTTSFTPGIKKVIDFLKDSFDRSIEEVEKKIVF